MKFSNNYYVMRHGESEVNSKGVALLNSADSKGDYGLTSKGREQVLQKFKNSSLDDGVIVYTSDFLRCVDSAKIVSSDFVETKLLRELQYYVMDERDLDDGFEIKQGIADTLLAEETVENVLSRINKLVEEIEVKFSGKNILLITHQDTAEFIQAFFKKSPLRLNFGEIVKVN